MHYLSKWSHGYIYIYMYVYLSSIDNIKHLQKSKSAQIKILPI